MREALVPIGMTALVAVLCSMAICHANRVSARCTDNGGRWVSTNCHVVEDQQCMTTDYGQGMVITTCMPTTSTVCDRVCIGAKAEAEGAQ